MKFLVWKLLENIKKGFPNCLEGVNLMIAPLRTTSFGDLEKWERFIVCLKFKKISPEEVSSSDGINS